MNPLPLPEKRFGKDNGGASGASGAAQERPFGVRLDPAGVDIISIRKNRAAVTHIFIYEEGELIGACHGNTDPNTGNADYINGTRGQPDGDYKLLPKPEADYDGELMEYLPGTPSVTGAGFPVGKPGDGYRNTIRFHPCGGSLACQTAPLRWANLVWDLMVKFPGKTVLHLRTSSSPEPITEFREPRSKSHIWPAFTGGEKRKIP